MPLDNEPPATGELTTDELAALKSSHESLPRRVRDVIYGRLAERQQIIALLDAMSREHAAKLSADPAWVAKAGGAITRDPILDHLIALLAGCSHVPEADRTLAPLGDGVAIVGLSATEREHFGRDG